MYSVWRIVNSLRTLTSVHWGTLASLKILVESGSGPTEKRDLQQQVHPEWRTGL